MIHHRKISRFITSVEDRLDEFGRGEWDLEANVNQSTWATRPDLIIGYRTTEMEQQIIRKMEKFPKWFIR